MKPEKPECPEPAIRIEDPDSGLDNSSDSGHSCDDEISTPSSDADELFSDKSQDGINSSSPNSSHHHIEIKTCTHWIEDYHQINLSEPKTPELDSKPIKLECDHKELSAVLELESFLTHESLVTEPNNNAVTSKIYDNLPEYYVDLMTTGKTETIDFSVSLDDRPDWLDLEKFKRGQKFALDHLFGINFAEVISLFILFSTKWALEPLIFTGNSDTPFKSFKRYLSTLSRLKTWYEEDLWGKESNIGKTNMSIVKGMHKNVHLQISSATEEEYDKKVSLGNSRELSSRCPVKDVAAEDFKGSCPMSFAPDLNKHRPEVIVSQTAMAFTQFAFVGLTVTYPKSFGIHHATDEDLEAFIHLWRGLGFLLGIKDKYNFCNGNLDTVRTRTKDFIDVVIKPAMRDVTAEWEYMTRCLVDGVEFYIKGFYFESALLYICHVLNIHTPRLKKYVSYTHYFLFLVTKFVYEHLTKIPAVFRWFNRNVQNQVKKAQTASPEVLKKWEEKKFSYMAK